MTPNPESAAIIGEVKGALNALQEGFKGFGVIPEQVKTLAATVDTLKGLPGELKSIQEIVSDLQKHSTQLRKLELARKEKAKNNSGIVTDECAKWLASMAIVQGFASKHFEGFTAQRRDTLAGIAAENLSLEGRVIEKAAITTSDIPMPVDYSGQIVELVFKYGVVRNQFTTFPISTASMQLPRLTTDPTFGLLSINSAITQVSPQMSFVTFTPAKWGGLIVLPTEIEMDSIVPLGQFIARYAARNFARIEDTVGFLADGTGTYNSISGIGKTADTASYSVVLATTKTHPSDIALADVRNLRAQVTGAVLPTSAYYAHPSMEALFSTFNTSTIKYWDAQAKTLDGFPVIWSPVMPVYTTAATINAYQLLFGDASYWYFGNRLGPSVETSNQPLFNSDQLAVRMYERFDIKQMGVQATAVLKLAAS